jgi:hypothetical protein
MALIGMLLLHGSTDRVLIQKVCRGRPLWGAFLSRGAFSSLFGSVVALGIALAPSTLGDRSGAVHSLSKVRG